MWHLVTKLVATDGVKPQHFKTKIKKKEKVKTTKKWRRRSRGRKMEVPTLETVDHSHASQRCSFTATALTRCSYVDRQLRQRLTRLPRHSISDSVTPQVAFVSPIVSLAPKFLSVAHSGKFLRSPNSETRDVCFHKVGHHFRCQKL